MKFRVCNYETKFWVVVLLSHMKDQLTLLGCGWCVCTPIEVLEDSSETKKLFS